MAQHDYAIANASGATVRADINDALEAIVSQNSGASAPGTTYAYMLWADTTTALLKMRDSTNASWVTIGTLDATALGLGNALPGHLFGLTISNNGADATNDIDIAIGQATSDDAAAADRVLMTLSGALTKRLDAGWSVGTNQGGLDTGSAANTTYHVFLIERPDTGVVDVLLSASASSPTLPANYTKKRRIGSILRESAAIVGFVQVGDTFLRKVPIASYASGANPGTSALTVTLSVPVGLSDLIAIFNANLGAHTALSVTAFFSSLAQTDTAAAVGATQSLRQPGVDQWAAGQYRLPVNTSGQIRARLNGSDAATVLSIGTDGWIDSRGRLA